MDAATAAVLEKGKRNVEVLKQPQYSPVSVEKQVAMMYLATKNLLRNVPVDKVSDFEHTFLMTLEQRHPQALADFKKGNLSDEATKNVEALAIELASQFK